MLILHQYHMSPYNQKIQRMLNAKGVPFEEKYWRIADRGKVLKINPIGKLPALEHDGKIVADSTEMAYYIESTFPEPPLVPRSPDERGRVHVLEDWADESLYFYEMRLRFNTPGNQQRNVERITEPEAPVPRWLMRRIFPRVIRKLTGSQGVGRKSMAQLLVDTERHIRAVSDMLDDALAAIGHGIERVESATDAPADSAHNKTPDLQQGEAR